MKIAYRHLVHHIEENPSIEHISHKLFQLGHEHEIDGDIFNMEFTPNRGDCLSINGLLRDLAVFYTVDYNQEIFTEKLNELHLDFENLSECNCPKISFLKLEIEQVPETYKNFLDNYFLDLGLSKNNFFTDVSNYISYQTGQPTHCYDASTMSGKLLFHEIEKNEEFETLLDKKITLTGKNSVFSLNDNIINLAGIVGGKSTSCSKKTKTVIVECGFFKPEAIIGKSVKYDIQSEASHKFERGVDPECHEKILRRFIKVVSEHTNIKEMSVFSYKSKDNPIHQLSVNVKKINQIIGVNITEDEYLNYLSKLHFDIEKGIIKVPSFRSDVKTQNDLAEEVARVIGYDNIPTSEISIPKKEKTYNKDLENKLRFFLLDHGFYEVVNSPFVSLASDKAIKVDNPLDSNREFLRTNITDSLVENLLYNERRQKDSIKLFEISDIYSFNSNIHKKRKLSIVASGRVGLNYQDFSTKIDIKYLRQVFNKIFPNLDLNFKTISREALNTKVTSEIISLEVDLDFFDNEIINYQELSEPPKEFAQYLGISELPSSYKDISYSIRDYSKCQELQDFVLGYQSEIIKKIFVFDYYVNQKREEIKIGFRFIFQSNKKTLTSLQIEDIINDIKNRSLMISGIAIPGLGAN